MNPVHILISIPLRLIYAPLPLAQPVRMKMVARDVRFFCLQLSHHFLWDLSKQRDSNYSFSNLRNHSCTRSDEPVAYRLHLRSHTEIVNSDVRFFCLQLSHHFLWDLSKQRDSNYSFSNFRNHSCTRSDEPVSYRLQLRSHTEIVNSDVRFFCLQLSHHLLWDLSKQRDSNYSFSNLRNHSCTRSDEPVSYRLQLRSHREIVKVSVLWGAF
jgi:hypothetical protein